MSDVQSPEIYVLTPPDVVADADITAASEEFIYLRDGILNDENAKHDPSHVSPNYVEKWVTHSQNPDIKLIATYHKITSPEPIEQSKLAIQELDGSGESVKIDQDTLKTWNVHEDKFTAYIMNIFRSHFNHNQ